MRRLFSPGCTGLLALAVLLGAGVGQAQADIILGTEDIFNGFIGRINTNLGVIEVASDGDFVAFQPFGVTEDTSDAIRFATNDWQVDPNHLDAFAAGFWHRTGTFPLRTWDLPAITPGGSEDEPSIEPIAGFIRPGFQFNAASVGVYVILDPDGLVSDTIVLSNNGPNGSALVTFSSDPVPEPGSLTLLGIGAATLLGYGWRRRKTAAA